MSGEKVFGTCVQIVKIYITTNDHEREKSAGNNGTGTLKLTHPVSTNTTGCCGLASFLWKEFAADNAVSVVGALVRGIAGVHVST